MANRNETRRVKKHAAEAVSFNAASRQVKRARGEGLGARGEEKRKRTAAPRFVPRSSLVGRLPKREAAILRARFGLDDGPERTLEEVGEEFGVTRERVRQLQNLALQKMRRMISALEVTSAAA